MNSNRAILATLCYHDIFDYPLNQSEIHTFLIERKASTKKIESDLSSLVTKKMVSEYNRTYALKGRELIFKLREKREAYSNSKLKRANNYAQILKIIPTIKLVAISGALAMKNSGKTDDIDFVIVAKKGTLWTTRILVTLLLLPVKRDRAGKKVEDKVCLNIFLDESTLKIKNENLYTAHEIVQMKPIWERDNAYSRFIRTNNWIKKHLPNWSPNPPLSDEIPRIPSATYSPLQTVENLLKNFQLWYMRKKITKEKITKGQLFFHPEDIQDWVLEKYQKKLMRLKLAA